MTQRRIQAHSSNLGRGHYVTKVLSIYSLVKQIAFILLLLACAGSPAQSPTPSDVSAKPAEALYLKLGSVGLDPERVFQVRGAAITRSAIQITLEDGLIAFTQDINGHTTGAFFEGEGEILLSPPNAVERRSMSFFTGMAILEERFETAYFRFNDDTVSELTPDLRQTDAKLAFANRWGSTAKNLASADAMRLLTSFSSDLDGAVPQTEAPQTAGPQTGMPHASPELSRRVSPQLRDVGKTSAGTLLNRGDSHTSDRFLHARLQGTKLGVFDVYFDSLIDEQVQAGQPKTGLDGQLYYNVWTSFAPVSGTPSHPKSTGQPPSGIRGNSGNVLIRSFTIDTRVLPPKQIQAHSTLQMDVLDDGSRILLFELSRALQVQSVKVDGQPVEFIHNPALEGTQLARQGNDVVAVVLAKPVGAGTHLKMEFEYTGDVLAEAGAGLLYVGARGTWYPNRGMQMADFDLSFTYPADWTLTATGKPTATQPSTSPTDQTSRWISERPLPVAGFNLGRYREVKTQAGAVSVETYATQSVEKDFPTAHIAVVEPPPGDRTIPRTADIVAAPRPSPALNAALVGESAAQAINYFSTRFGPFPYSHLALTQMPGRDSQGWPGLIFLSSFAFLNDRERQDLHFAAYRIALQKMIPAHETAHQWWGDLIGWKGYRDQWLSEGLANYCALMMLQEKDPSAFRQILQKYREDLSEKDKNDLSPLDAGPVTLGTRLFSSRVPQAYEAVSYGRGTWLFHMLRTMMNDASSQERGRRVSASASADEPFVRALRNLRQRYEGKSISTQELLAVFVEQMPKSLRYEGKNSLDWFLEGWINGTSMPRLELKNLKFVPGANGVTVTGTIQQNDAPQDLVTSVPLYAATSGRTPVFVGRVFADGDESSFRITAPPGTHKLLLDPYNTILTGGK